jgi:hypothetical protein
VHVHEVACANPKLDQRVVQFLDSNGIRGNSRSGKRGPQFSRCAGDDLSALDILGAQSLSHGGFDRVKHRRESLTRAQMAVLRL